MSTKAVQIANAHSRLIERDTEDALRKAEESTNLNEQSREQMLWRMKEENAMAKIKAMSKLAEAANQL